MDLPHFQFINVIPNLHSELQLQRCLKNAIFSFQTLGKRKVMSVSQHIHQAPSLWLLKFHSQLSVHNKCPFVPEDKAKEGNQYTIGQGIYLKVTSTLCLLSHYSALLFFDNRNPISIIKEANYQNVLFISVQEKEEQSIYPH